MLNRWAPWWSWCTTAPTTCWSSPNFWSTPASNIAVTSFSDSSLSLGLSPGKMCCCYKLLCSNMKTWNVSRCGVFPAWILYSTVHDAGNFFELSPLYYLFLVLLGLLQLLNLIWTFMLVKAIRSAIVQQGAHDSRSDSEPSSMDEGDENYNLDLKKKDWYSTSPQRLSLVQILHSKRQCQCRIR